MSRNGRSRRMQPNQFRLPQGHWNWIAVLILSVILGVLNKLGGNPAGTHEPGAPLSGMPKLVDGDSFFLAGSEVRLKGIDAPEGKQTCERGGRTWSCGEEARRELQRLVGSGPITCASATRDQHGRWLAICSSSSGRELNAGMVAAGFAVDYGGYPREESQARIGRRGLWSGEFERPRDWRRRNGIGG